MPENEPEWTEFTIRTSAGDVTTRRFPMVIAPATGSASAEGVALWECLRSHHSDNTDDALTTLAEAVALFGEFTDVEPGVEPETAFVRSALEVLAELRDGPSNDDPLPD